MIRWKAGLTVVLLLFPIMAFAQKVPKFPIEQFTLENGLRVVLSEDHSIPRISLVVAYNVGSRNEVKSHTGFAHLFEHMMFQGSANVGRGEYARYIEASGGDYNGATQDEVTHYEASVPPEKLPLALWMEADRMRSLAVTKDNLNNQREVVKEEKRMRMDNQPYQSANLRIQELAYSNFANQHLPIGSMADLDAASLEYVQTFFKTYYAPNNAVLALVGDFNPKEAHDLIEKQFGSIPRGSDPPRPDLSEPKPLVGQTVTITDTFASVPALFMAWRTPPVNDPDSAALDLLNTLLFQQETQRALSDIGGGDRWILQFQGGQEDHRGPSLFRLVALYRPDVKAETIKNEILVQIERLKSQPPSKEEMERVRTRYLADHYRREVEPLNRRAFNLAVDTLWLNDPNFYFTQMERYHSVTPEQVQAVAKKYLMEKNCAVVIVRTSKQPTEKEDQE